MGQLPEYGEAHDILPARSDFAALWRYFVGLGGQLRGNLSQILHILGSTGMHPGMVCAMLRVFSESGLIALSTDGDDISITQTETQGKADLAAAPFMRLLTEAAKTGG